jgi:hypothetical protein
MENVFIAEMIVLLVLTILLLLVQLAYRYFMVGCLIIMVVVLSVMIINAGCAIHMILQCVFSANICSTWVIQISAFLVNKIVYFVAVHQTAICVC